jgi:hypothetical protein
MAQRIEVWLCEQHWELLGSSLKSFVGVLPQQLHIIPVFNDAVAHGILHLQQSLPIRVELLANYYVGLIRSGNHHLILGPTDANISTGSTLTRRLWASLRLRSLP